MGVATGAVVVVVVVVVVVGTSVVVGPPAVVVVVVVVGTVAARTPARVVVVRAGGVAGEGLVAPDARAGAVAEVTAPAAPTPPVATSAPTTTTSGTNRATCRLGDPDIDAQSSRMGVGDRRPAQEWVEAPHYVVPRGVCRRVRCGTQRGDDHRAVAAAYRQR